MQNKKCIRRGVAAVLGRTALSPTESREEVIGMKKISIEIRKLEKLETTGPRTGPC